MIRHLVRLWRSIFHVSSAMFVHVSPDGVLIVPAGLVSTSGGPRHADGWKQVRDQDELDRYLANVVDRCLSHLAELER